MDANGVIAHKLIELSMVSITVKTCIPQQLLMPSDRLMDQSHLGSMKVKSKMFTALPKILMSLPTVENKLELNTICLATLPK
jgi:hypothetical protein